MFFGINNYTLNQSRLKTEKCPNCHKDNSLIGTIKGYHLHLFRIPILPLLKRGKIQCRNCQSEFKPSQAPQIIKSELNILKGNTRFNWFQYAGVCLLLAFTITSFTIEKLAVKKESNEVEQTSSHEEKETIQLIDKENMYR